MNWYHISYTWNETLIVVNPMVVRSDDNINMKPCICVCPSIIQCILALGDWRSYNRMLVYITNGTPEKANVFDSSLTDEHRFHETKIFNKYLEIKTDHLKIIPSRKTCGISEKLILSNLIKDRIDLSKILNQFYP